MEQKRQLLKLLLQNPTLEGKKVRYSLIKPFDTILNYADRQLWLRGKDSDLQPYPYSNPLVAKRPGLSHVALGDPGI